MTSPAPISKLIHPARATARRTLAAGLNLVPLGAFQPLRRAYPASPQNSPQETLQNLLLQVVRYRGIPRELESFPLTDNPEISICNTESFIAERLYWFGQDKGYEPEVLRWWLHFCARSTNILELGTNIGYFAVQGARRNPAARYTGVEPHPGAAAACRRNLAINGITNVTVVEAAAVGDSQASTIRLHLPGGRDHYEEAPCSGFAASNELHHQEVEDVDSYHSITVQAVKLANLIPGVDLLKIDVEGQEHTLLSSVERQIRELRPTMFLEVLDGTHRLRWFLQNLCDTLPYRCLVPTRNALVPLPASELPTVSLVDQFATRDLVMVCDPAGG